MTSREPLPDTAPFSNGPAPTELNGPPDDEPRLEPMLSAAAEDAVEVDGGQAEERGGETLPTPEEEIPAASLASTLESLLFVADEPVEPTRLAQALRCSVEDVNGALAHLRAEYDTHNRGVRLQERNGKVQLVTNPAAAQAVEDFLSLDLTSRLSGPALETLAIIAYRQPVTRAQIEAVRGVDCSGMVRKLEQQGLVEEVGRLETVGRPILYGVTDQFLQHFGLTRLEELPALPALDADSLRAVVALAAE